MLSSLLLRMLQTRCRHALLRRTEEHALDLTDYKHVHSIAPVVACAPLSLQPGLRWDMRAQHIV
jgi:hypothetical protein